jgi:hypothetical protein
MRDVMTEPIYPVAPVAPVAPVVPAVAERWALTRLTPACPQCGAALMHVLNDNDTNWLTDCQPHNVHCHACDLTVRAYFSVTWPRAVL